MVHRPFLLMTISLAIFERVAVSLYSYSGAGSPPMFGDYEAQRHWMEVTYNLPMDQWYINSSTNDLNYWGLDYPPLTAYHSWILGTLSAHINHDWILLGKSRGYESYNHKLFMRLSVLATDSLIFFTAVIAYIYVTRSEGSNNVFLRIVSILCLPSLILIDHGHFQYNSISLGFCVWGIVGVASGWDVFGSIAYCLAINYKQMELYHSLPFFCYLLGKAYTASHNKIETVNMITKLAVTVVIIFGVCWIPFASNGINGIVQVFRRVFPLSRGIFEDKVASFWCSISVILKIKKIFEVSTLVWMSTMATFLASMPSLFLLVRNPTINKFLLNLVISSLSFFLFSFHVHEKSIILVCLPVSLIASSHPLFAAWFNTVATFSMYPLLTKDGLTFPTWTVSGVFFAVVLFGTPWTFSKKLNHIQELLMFLSMFTLLVLCLLSHIAPILERFPDIFAVLISSYSCFLFLLSLVYLTYILYTS